jgi:hypothetical protein
MDLERSSHMHRGLLGLAAMSAALVIPSPASAQGAVASSGFSAVSGTQRIGVLTGRPGGEFGRRGGFGDGHRHHIRVDGRVQGGGYYSSGYNDYGDYDANRSFDPDKWNDWWHDRPDRAFPRWMSRNQGCERPWYSGDVLTC